MFLFYEIGECILSESQKSYNVFYVVIAVVSCEMLLAILRRRFAAAVAYFCDAFKRQLL